MGELTLVGLHDDGEHVVLEGPDGQRFRLRIDEALRAAVRRDRPGMEQVRAGAGATLPPREIQSRVRAGATAEQIAEQTGTPVETIHRYEGPVLAEREWIAEQARATRIGHDVGAPTLGDLAGDRLATRGVAQSSILWDSARDGGAPWTVELTFEVSEARRSARWSFDVGARTLRALDDEARWLSETELADEPIPRRHLTAVRTSVFDVEVDEALRPLLASVDTRDSATTGDDPTPAEPSPEEATAALLDDLQGRRGVRQPLVEADEDDAEFEGFGPQHAFDFERPGATQPVPGAHPPDSRPDLATDATVLEMPRRSEPHGGATPPATEEPAAHDHGADTVAQIEPDHATSTASRRAKRSATAAMASSPATPVSPAPTPDPEPGTEVAQRPRSRRGRASVPTWDEIVFGAKPE